VASAGPLSCPAIGYVNQSSAFPYKPITYALFDVGIVRGGIFFPLFERGLQVRAELLVLV
jgi:hypothetical protein